VSDEDRDAFRVRVGRGDPVGSTTPGPGHGLPRSTASSIADRGCPPFILVV
jgi:hypothetical protein